MPLRSSRFYLFGYLHYYGHIRLPRLWGDFLIPLGSPTFMRYLPLERNPILPRRVQTVHLIVSSGLMAGFVNSDRLATLICVTRLKGQLTKAFALNLMQFVSLLHLRVTSIRTTNLIAWFFHPCRYLIYICARLVAYQRTTEILRREPQRKRLSKKKF